MRIGHDSGQPMEKQTTAINEKIWSGRNVEDDSSMPRRVISVTEITAPSDENLINCTKFEASGGSVKRIACGRTMRRKLWNGVKPRTCAASRWPFGTAWMPAR